MSFVTISLQTLLMLCGGYQPSMVLLFTPIETISGTSFVHTIHNLLVIILYWMI